MEPIFTNDAIVLGILIVALALIFYTSSLDNKRWKKFYTYVPTLLLCYFVPAFLHWPFGLIAPEWYDMDLIGHLQSLGVGVPDNFSSFSFNEVNKFLAANGVDQSAVASFKGKTQLYFMASRYLLPASLILLCLSIDLKGIINLGPKSLIMFVTATFGIIIGGPIALLITNALFPDVIGSNGEDIWKGLSTVAGSWIGGGANQTAMKEIFEVGDNLFGTMIVIDVVVANIWMGFLLYGANITERIDGWLKSDTSAIEDLKNRISEYRASIEKIPTLTNVFVLMGVAFGGVALSHWGKDVVTPFMTTFKESLEAIRLNSLMSPFFWLIVFATTIGLALSFTRAKKLEGVGASRWGSVFIYALVATIGVKMNLGEVFSNLGLFAIGIIWMLVHVTLLLGVGKLIKAPFFFIAVGSQANIGGAASAPIVASAFSPSLAPVGVLLAVLGYALGTYGAIICAFLMQGVSG